MIKSPFISYYGGKFKIRKKYPAPIYNTIIEPFAGFAGYSTLYPHLDIRLYDCNSDICQIWDFLINVSESEFLTLPTDFECVPDLQIPEIHKLYLSYVCNYGTPCRNNYLSKYSKGSGGWNELAKQKKCNQLQYIRHWKIYHDYYWNIDNEYATWFIDPPYSGAVGKRYTFYLDVDDYQHLSEWVKTTAGQVIVCEQLGADWLDFNMLSFYNGAAKQSIEAIYYQIDGVKQEYVRF